MLKQISYTFGTVPVLQKIMDKYPDRYLKLTQAVEHDDNTALFDLSGEKSIFNSPVKLKTVTSNGSDNFSGVLHVDTFKVGLNRRKALLGSMKQVLTDAPASMMAGYILKGSGETLTILTVWPNMADIAQWHHSHAGQPLASFMAKGSENTYFDETYQPVSVSTN